MELNRFKQLLESTMGNVKPLIMEQKTILGKWTSTIPDDGEHDQGFYHIRINSNNNISSIINKWDGGQQESDKKELASDEPKENNTIGATFWIKGTANQTFKINITGTSGSTNLNCNIKDENLNGYAFYFTNLSVGTYTITASNSSIDSLTVVVS
jgi:hypothetical protein